MRQPPRPVPVLRTVGLLLTCVALILVGGPLPAQAATAGWATFAPLAGSSKDYTTTMRQQPAGFPAAQVRSTSVGGSAVGVQTSAFLAPTTPPGARYGSSRGETYLNLRPNGLAAASPSVTTYTFARPTPSTGWTFVLGDVDADAVTIEATGADDEPVDAADLGFRGAFNYCAPGTSPKPPCAPPNNDGLDLPTWIPSTSTLRGNATALDTAGASGWFEPRVALTTLTFTYAQRAGSPVYQTWFSALEHSLSGTVTAPSAIREGLTVRLLDADGNEVATARTAADGAYSFPGYATYADYRVALDRPDGYTSDGDLVKPADLSERDATVDFGLRAVVGANVSGAVQTPGGDPVPDVTVTVTGPNGFVKELVTDSDGGYLLDGVPAGDGYVVTVTVPDGYAARGTTTRTFDVPVGSESSITVPDFVVAPIPLGTISGTVTDDRSGDALSTVEIRVTGPGGFERVVRTDENGNYALEDVPAGDYTITVVPPDDGTVVGTATRTATITDQGNTVDDRNFRIAFPVAAPTYTAQGTVLDENGDPVPGSKVILQPPGFEDPVVVDVDADGTFVFPGLGVQNYTVTVVAPRGYEVVGDASIVFPVDDADVTGLDFVLRRITASAAPTATSTSSAVSASGTLADTGSSSAFAPLLGLGLIVVAAGGLVLYRARRGRRE